MFQLRIPSRPVRYAIVAAHTLRDALDDWAADKRGYIKHVRIARLADKVALLKERLEALDDDIDDTPNDTPQDTPQDKEKDAKHGRATTRKPRAKAKKRRHG